jgi:hypothetical protein
MGFSDIIHHAGLSFGIWAGCVLLVVIMGILFALQSSKVNAPGSGQTAKTLGNAIAAAGIVLCFVVLFGWCLSLIILSRDASNTWADPTSIYVSRKNILVNWHNSITEPGTTGTNLPKIGNAISGCPPTDGANLCFSNFGNNVGPASFTEYDKLIANYASTSIPPATLDQYYTVPPPAGSALGTTPPVVQHFDTALNQERLSLAYYRFVYCHKTYIQDLVNGTNITAQNFPFVTATTLANLQKGVGCVPASSTVPDYRYCLDSNWPSKTATCTAPNPCFVALNQAIAAQCLLYDDTVYAGQHPGDNPRGALGAMEVTDWMTGGYQVVPPTDSVCKSVTP